MNAEPGKSGRGSADIGSDIFGRERFDAYIRRFNARDATAFDDYLARDAVILNGTLELRGVQGMRRHYEEAIWPFFEETIHINRFISDSRTLAVNMWTHFVATVSGASLFGQVREGDAFDFRGLVMYEIENARFFKIIVAYNSFIRTDATGTMTELGLPH
ncbi:MAG: nuclear transport factor 2 family protein [Alphaproteobacteria bacterium]|nr:nuclear transport factor 2 family protein [Alphaproteobacteria bacterium]MBU6471837.1 nuclear transport factor 2 family protein [Alphaproteobacteria bacterium]MDE2011493.1 nuclear transport factor 2 family protein [Alphaproteobacteria bacterium]MDE2071884.1 nuclear transport factor 2 family protein [Alphaproteobacteria bacterium]MDE2350396.1 nuclear transport factor 2 family protein [Alphaproteobacteria bacterium]